MGATAGQVPTANGQHTRPAEYLSHARDAHNLLKLLPKGEGCTPPNWKQERSGLVHPCLSPMSGAECSVVE